MMSSKSPAHLPLPRHSSNGSRRNGPNPTDARLSIIVEDGVLSPVPIKTHNRPFSRRWNIGEPPRHSFETPPPSYSVWDVTGPKGEKLADVRNNKYIAGRGGPKRICLIAFLISAALVALIVGLAVGLNKKHKKGADSTVPPSSNSSSPTSPSTAGPFPVGSYTFTTYLETVTTNCTSAPMDWQCAPYHTYSESPSQAKAPFQWIIVESGSPSSSNLSISSSSNPFYPSFSNATLTLVDRDSGSEQYSFKTTFDKIVILPGGVYCYFNDTVLQGSLFTKKPKSSPAQTAASSTAPVAQPSATGDVASNTFAEWRYAVEATQSIGGGATIPECFQMNEGIRGAQVSGGIPQAPADVCSCVFKNYDL